MRTMFLYFGVCLLFVVYASLVLDGLPFYASKDFKFILIAPDKATKQSRDLSVCVHCFIGR